MQTGSVIAQGKNRGLEPYIESLVRHLKDHLQTEMLILKVDDPYGTRQIASISHFNP
jgi:hypothetical protein